MFEPPFVHFPFRETYGYEIQELTLFEQCLVDINPHRIVMSTVHQRVPNQNSCISHFPLQVDNPKSLVRRAWFVRCSTSSWELTSPKSWASRLRLGSSLQRRPQARIRGFVWHYLIETLGLGPEPGLGAGARVAGSAPRFDAERRVNAV